MRRVHLMGLAALAMVAVVVAALAQTPTPAPSKAPAQAAPTTQQMQGDAPDMTGDDEDGMERMDGPDAWDRMDMGPAGLFVSDPRHGYGPMRMRALGERRRELAKQLELTPEQRDKLEVIRDRQQRMGIEQRAKIHIARLDLRTLLRAEKPDRRALEAKVDEISRMQAQLGKARVGMLLDMRAVLTPEQQQKLRSLRNGGDI